MQIFDITHNPAAAHYFAKKLNNMKTKYNRTLAVFSMLSDKDIQGTITPLQAIIDEWHISTLNHQRAASIDQLKNAFNTLTIKTYHTYSSLTHAYQRALSRANSHDQIIIFGSCQIFKALEVKPIFQTKNLLDFS
jgi:dihydrofolate synthase/folylpolyglutamate synthase